MLVVAKSAVLSRCRIAKGMLIEALEVQFNAEPEVQAFERTEQTVRGDRSNGRRPKVSEISCLISRSDAKPDKKRGTDGKLLGWILRLGGGRVCCRELR